MVGVAHALSALKTECLQLWRLRGLLRVLTRRELAARFAGSAGGVLWAWLPPLLTVAAYYLVFDVVFGMRLGDRAPTARVGTYLIVGMLAWMAFADTIQRGTGSLVEAGNTLHKNPLPPGLFPARSVLASMSVYAPLLLVLMGMYANEHHFQPGVWAVPIILVFQGVLSFLLAYLLAILAAALRDVTQVVGVLLSLGVFLSPVLFPIDLFPMNWRWLLWLNPMTGPVLGYQSALLQGKWPALEVWVAMGAWIALLSVLLSVALSRSRDQLVDWL